MSLGLLITAFTFGLRHGVDWDHIAAIADLSSSAENRRKGFMWSMLYALGHGAVVFALGTIAILAGAAIPDGVDVWMGRIVGVTLIALGAWILVELARKGRSFRLQSRWMLVINGTFAGMRRVRAGFGGRKISVEHDHGHQHVDDEHAEVQAHDHAHVAATITVDEPVTAGASPSAGGHPAGKGHTHHRHGHSHSHDLLLPSSAKANYGAGTATGIGMLHGIGIESPTQIAVFVASTAAAGAGFGIAILGAWVLGLIIANAGLALMAGAGLLHAERSFPIYASLAVVVAVLSIAMGTLYLGGFDILPDIF